jgi:hypothetical protein
MCDVKSGHSIEWNSFDIAETPDDGRLGPKYIVKGRSGRNICIIDGIMSILFIKELMKFDRQKIRNTLYVNLF